MYRTLSLRAGRAADRRVGYVSEPAPLRKGSRDETWRGREHRNDCEGGMAGWQCLSSPKVKPVFRWCGDGKKSKGPERAPLCHWHRVGYVFPIRHLKRK